MVAINQSMANQVTRKILPKTGTAVTKVYDGVGNVVSKTVIPGSGNKISKYTNSYITSYSNGKPSMLTTNNNFGFGDCCMVSKLEKNVIMA